MMKKLVLAALALCAVVAPSFAQENAPARWTFEDLKFRNYRAANPAPGFIDSTYASGIAKFDTTTAISTDGWLVPGIGSGVDSATVARLLIYDSGLFADVSAGKTSATAESIYVKTQVSPNGSIWFDCAVIPGQAPVLNAFTVQTTVNAAVLTFTNSTNTGISDKMWSVRYVAAQGAAGGKVIPDIYSIHTFPYVRWIISGTRATTNHALKAKVGFMSAANR
jgi:hypothetical protein